MYVISLDTEEVVGYDDLRDPVVIVWIDHVSYTESLWRSFDEMKELRPMEVKSVGYILSETPEYIILASHVTNSDTGMGELLIVKDNITEMKVLVPKLSE